MKAIVLFDDYVFDASGEKVMADETVSFSLDGEAFEIDLTAENAKKIREDIGRWSRLGAPVSRPRAPKRPLPELQPTPAGFRAWADERGINYHTPGGGIYHKVKDVRAYEAWLAGQA